MLRRLSLAIAATAVLVSSTASAFAHPAGREFIDGHWVTQAQYGETWQGGLDSADYQFNDGSRVEFYTFNAFGGDCVDITMTSSNVDSFLLLRYGSWNGPTLSRNDDGAGGHDARIRTRLPRAASYYILVSTYGSGEHRGQYALTLNRDPRGC
jgi:hypothetical protein